MTPITGGLRRRVLEGGSWSVAGTVLSQLLRFGSNLVLTRLLFPEAFGVMAIINAILVGITLLSDVGLSMSIVRSKRGEEPVFLNTIWTMQIVKGLLVALGLWLVAGPVANAYQQPLLAQMLPTMGLVAVLSGLKSTKGDVATRHIRLARPTLIAFGAQTTGIVVMILLAWLHPSPWALLWGGVASAAAGSIASHVLLPGASNRLAWERQAIREVAQFGGWVLLSSGITFLAGEGMQLLRAALVDARLLGLMGLSSALSLTVWSVIQQLSSKVFFAAYAEVWRTDPARLASVVARSRRIQLLAGGLFSAVLAVTGTWIIGLLYDARYSDAGLVLQIQAAGNMISLLTASYTGVLMAMGRPGLSAALLAVQVVITMGCMTFGAWVLGPVGVVIGGASAAWLMYPVNSAVFARLGLWQPKTDLPVMAAAVMVAVWVGTHTNWAVTATW